MRQANAVGPTSIEGSFFLVTLTASSAVSVHCNASVWCPSVCLSADDVLRANTQHERQRFGSACSQRNIGRAADAQYTAALAFGDRGTVSKQFIPSHTNTVHKVISM